MAAVDVHPHLAQPKRPGWVRVDMHTHTMWSGDATTTPDELAEAVADSGIDVLCITDHNTIKGALALCDRLPCRVIVGQEVRTGAGELIGLFLTERLPHGIKAADAAGRIRSQGGVVYVPHPYDPMRHCLSEEALDQLLEEGAVDLIEVFNAKTSLDHLNRRAADTADRFGLPHGAGSDAHVPSAFGAAYVEMPDFDGPESFLESVRQGQVVGHHYDAPRPWRARIVPSTSAFEGD
ncbi:MAG TPA: PHP domain-containing protein [Acidimicrobiales bacterium]|nr:PHP domain-containing protein [Acidimicrobiales bacterium]